MSDIGYLSYLEFKKGKEQAVNVLVHSCSDAITRYAYCYVKDASAAEDVMEETIATLLYKGKHFADEQRFRAYVYKVARNKSIDYLRRRGRELPLEDVGEILYAKDTEGTAIMQERNRILYECMQQLPLRYRDVLYLVYFEGFSPEEASRIMKKDKKQVYNLLARAKADLKQRLIKEGISHEDL